MPRAFRLSTVPALAVLCASVVSAQQSDRSRAEAAARRAGERLLTLQREADGLATQEKSLLNDLRKLEIERDLKTEQLKEVQAVSEQVERDLGNIGNQIDALEAQDSQLRPLLEARMVELYKLGSAGYVHLLFNVSDLKELGRAYRMVSSLAEIDRQRAEAHQQNLAQLKKARTALEQRTVELARLQKEAADAQAAAQRATVAREQLIAQIDKRRDLTAQLTSELQAAQQRLQQTLGASTGSGEASASQMTLPIRPFKGALDWPVKGRVMQRFVNRRRGAAPHSVAASQQDGIQIAAEEGADVQAVHDGTVAFAGPFAGYGNLVIVDHGANTFSLYGQLESVTVARGAHVDKGQPVGSAGRVLVGIPGIYFEMRVDGQPVDPLEWLKKRP